MKNLMKTKRMAARTNWPLRKPLAKLPLEGDCCASGESVIRQWSREAGGGIANSVLLVVWPWNIVHTAPGRVGAGSISDPSKASGRIIDDDEVNSALEVHEANSNDAGMECIMRACG